MFSSVWRNWIIAGGGAIALYILLCLWLRFNQNRLMFVPYPPTEETPRDLGIAYEDVWLSVPFEKIQEKVHGWWIPAPDTSPSSITILHFHGNGGNLNVNVPFFEKWHQMGYAVFSIDYRGYGLSHNRFPNEERVYDDAEAAWKYLVSQRGIDPTTIVVFGHSMGGAIAIELATRHPKMAALVIEGSFSSMKAVCHQRGWSKFLPIDLLLTHDFNSIEKLQSLSLPILFIHAIEDEVVPAFMSQKLYDAAKGDKKLHWVEGGDHNNIAIEIDESQRQVMRQFIDGVRIPSPR